MERRHRSIIVGRRRGRRSSSSRQSGAAAAFFFARRRQSSPSHDEDTTTTRELQQRGWWPRCCLPSLCQPVSVPRPIGPFFAAPLFVGPGWLRPFAIPHDRRPPTMRGQEVKEDCALPSASDEECGASCRWPLVDAQAAEASVDQEPKSLPQEDALSSVRGASDRPMQKRGWLPFDTATTAESRCGDNSGGRQQRYLSLPAESIRRSSLSASNSSDDCYCFLFSIVSGREVAEAACLPCEFARFMSATDKQRVNAPFPLRSFNRRERRSAPGEPTLSAGEEEEEIASALHLLPVYELLLKKQGAMSWLSFLNSVAEIDEKTVVLVDSSDQSSRSLPRLFPFLAYEGACSSARIVSAPAFLSNLLREVLHQRKSAKLHSTRDRCS